MVFFLNIFFCSFEHFLFRTDRVRALGHAINSVCSILMLFVLNSVRKVIIIDLNFDFILHFTQQNFFSDFDLGWRHIKLVSFPRGGYHCGGTDTGWGYHTVLAIDCGHGAGSRTGRGGACTRAHFDNMVISRRYCLACKLIINFIHNTLQKH